MRKTNWSKLVTLFALLVLCSADSPAADPNHAGRTIEISVLYDNYALCEECQADWGFSCLITGMEKNILFDTGAYGNILLHNMDTLEVDAGQADLLVISHNHGDHTGDWQSAGGLLSFLGRNNNVSVYLPPSVSSGQVQLIEAAGATAQIVHDPMQLCERVHLTGPMGGTVIEQSLVLETPKGLVVVTGCAHPGIVNIIQKAKQMLDKDVYFVFGGFHLLNDSNSQVMSVIRQFRELGVQKAGASHCTGDRAIELFKQEYGEDFVPIGVGRVRIPSECDLNGDGIVDCADICIMVNHWQTDEPSCDIAPPLFGDGIVDVQDLVLLAEHLFEEPALLAHWKLDETEGSIAHDRIGDNDGVLNGNPTWQPTGGKVDGALNLDGIDDYVHVPFLLNPTEGPFSVLAWVRGGAPGQVIISQADGANWLLADPSEGKLMTGLSRPPGGRTPPPPLVSEFVIIDGDWHRAGLVWDGSQRILYVDDVEAAKDTLSGLEGADGALYFGTGKNPETGSFWSGSIDDIRIYDRAVFSQ